MEIATLKMIMIKLRLRLGPISFTASEYELRFLAYIISRTSTWPRSIHHHIYTLFPQSWLKVRLDAPMNLSPPSSYNILRSDMHHNFVFLNA
ncbi:hypothetical protein ACOSQ4_008673 [Xanthoceras sorbifolium]